MAALAVHFIPASKAKSDAHVFYPLCAYWISQAFLIPILTVGPWPAWPTFADFAIFALVTSVILSRRRSAHIDWLTKTLFLIWGICLFSFLVATAIYGLKDRGVPFGLAQMIRLTQVIIATLATAKLRLTLPRINILGIITTSVFFFTAFGVFLTAILPVVTAASMLIIPPSASISGPWSSYAAGAVPGVGFVGYNHAYTGMQLLLLAGLALSLNKFRAAMRFIVWAVLIASAFASYSRAGFLCALLMCIAYEAKKSKTVIAALALVCIALGAYFVGSDEFDKYAERQKSAATSLNEDGLSGRTDIWKEHIEYFDRSPLALIFGSGFGFASHASENNAHNLYLHVATEWGIFGLVAFLAFFWKLLKHLKPCRPMWLTIVALLLTGLTQETFYPVLAFPQFLAFFFSAVILSSRVARMKTATISVSDTHKTKRVSHGIRASDNKV